MASDKASDVTTKLFAQGGVVTTVLGMSASKLGQLVAPLANLAYVLVVLYGFAKLPSNFMLVFGILTVFFGPHLLVYMLKITGALLSTAAYAPFAIILLAWIILFLRSKIFQRVGIALGLDLDDDGKVDWLDILWWCADSKLGKILRLQELYEQVCKWRAAYADADARLAKIEALLAAEAGQRCCSSPGGGAGMGHLTTGGAPHRSGGGGKSSKPSYMSLFQQGSAKKGKGGSDLV